MAAASNATAHSVFRCLAVGKVNLLSSMASTRAALSASLILLLSDRLVRGGVGDDKKYKFPLQICEGPTKSRAVRSPEEVPVRPGKNTTRFPLVWDREVSKIPNVTSDTRLPLLRGQSVRVALESSRNKRKGRTR